MINRRAWTPWRRPADPGLSDKQRFSLRENDVERAAKAKESEGEAAEMAEIEKGARALQKEFPKEPGAQKMLLEVATANEPGKSRVISWISRESGLRRSGKRRLIS